MNENTSKSATPIVTIILVVLGVGFLGLVGLGFAGFYYFKDKLALEPAKVAEIQESILPGSRLPEGYELQGGMDWMFRMATATGPKGEVLLILAGEKDTLEASARDPNRAIKIDGKELDDKSFKPVGRETLSVGGQEVVFEKKRGSGKDNAGQLQYVGLVTRPDGVSVMITFMGPEDALDLDAFKGFLASVNFGGKTMPPVEDGEPAKAESDTSAAEATGKKKAPR